MSRFTPFTRGYEANMKFFIDTANLEEIRRAASIGLLDGVTTNPSLVAKEKRDSFPLISFGRFQKMIASLFQVIR